MQAASPVPVSIVVALPRVFPLPLPLRSPNLPPSPRVLVAPPLLFRFRDHRRNSYMVSHRIDSHKSEIRRAYVLALLQEIVLHDDLDPNLHGSGEDAIHRRAQNDQIADVHWSPEIQMVNRGGDHIMTRMPMGGECTGEVNPVHQAAAEQRAQR